MKKVLIYIFLCCISYVYAEAGELLPGHVFSETSETLEVILVEKESKTLYFIKLQENYPYILKKYQVLTGKNGGDKFREGDSRTPEGIYFITGFIPSWKLDTRLYGIGAFPINYPNIVDRILNKTGHGIWLHGRGTDGRTSTNGCISLQNEDFLFIKERVGVNTPVVITPKIEFLTPDQYREKRKNLLKRLEDFIKDWQEGEFTRFRAWFSPRFKNSYNENLTAFLNRKRSIFTQEKDRQILVSDVVIFKENSAELMYQFRQLYCSDKYMDYGIKRLYFQTDSSEGQRVIAEEFQPLDVSEGLKPFVLTFLNQWKEAWQSEAIDRYMSFYGKEFRSHAGDLKAWKEYKKNVFEKYRIDQISISDVNIRPRGRGEIQVSFIQYYRASNLEDTGKKTLVLKGCPGAFKIIRERWQPL